jgi:hypothetical protein
VVVVGRICVIVECLLNFRLSTHDVYFLVYVKD